MLHVRKSSSHVIGELSDRRDLRLGLQHRDELLREDPGRRDGSARLHHLLQALVDEVHVRDDIRVADLQEWNRPLTGLASSKHTANLSGLVLICIESNIVRQ